jgi:hypothetical protein
MSTHVLKCKNPYFEECWHKRKPFEVRRCDRDFKEGDTVILKEYNPVGNIYSGREITAQISYILMKFDGIKKGYWVLGLKNMKNNSK